MNPVPARPPAEPAGGAPPPVLLRRVRRAGQVRDVLLAGGRVRAVGADLRAGAPGLDADAPAGAEVVDADGAVLLPGLVDSHVHLTQWAAARRRIDVLAAGSPSEVADVLAREAPAGDDLVVGHGFRDALWSEPPHGDVLEARFGQRPVLVVSADLHAAWVNPAAARRFGVPPEQAPDGLLREAAAMQLAAAAADVGADVGDRWVAEATRAAAARGVTGVVDLEYAPLSTWARRAAAGLHPALRVSAGVWPDWLEEVVAAGLRTGDPVPGAGGRVRVGPVKLVVDGSLGTRTAYCRHAYPDGGHGVLRLPPGQLEAVLRRATSHGLGAAVHAIGDAAVAVALDGFAAVGCTGSVEHAQQVAPADVARFAALDVVASIQPRHVVDDRDVLEVHWADGAGDAYPYASLHAAGARLRLGSDAPVAALDPWDAIASAVHRSVDGRPAWHPQQQLPLEVALPAACAGRTGVRVGDDADVVLVADEPAAVLARGGADALRRTEVLATLVGGEFTARSGL
ncbi:amidohydrolase family protein [Kineococcus vitellinus]|uniref:amidohydrolase family protein n=1 Tax=Kineococcus vitellinus TaxID=2696565 RepID=UPI00196AC122